MILADTSVWVDHFRTGNAALARFLSDGAVVMHPFVSGELACGSLPNREAALADLLALPQTAVATHHEILRFISDRRLWARGLGLVDVHLLASALLSTCRLWTLDKRLAVAASELGVA